MSELTLDDYLSDLEDAKCRLSDAEDDVSNSEAAIRNFCDENYLECPLND